MTDTIVQLEIGHQLDINSLIIAIQKGAKIVLSNSIEETIIECRNKLNKINAREEPVYGVSTGFGHLENKWIPLDKQGQLQVNLIKSHAIATGQKIPIEVVKTAMILLVNSLAKGHSGIRLDTVTRLMFFINNNIIPVSYQIGSLGASGDLAPLAHIALTLLGEGQVETSDGVFETAEILEKFELEPLELEAKEGLALINGTHFITAYSVLLLKKMKNLMKLSAITSGLSLEALRGTDTPFDKRIADLRGHPGHKIYSKIMRDVLSNSEIIASHKDPRIDHKTQDAYAFRCIPQVMGAVWDTLGFLERVVEIEINAVTDNPLIFPHDEEILSGGNFHAEPLGFPLESSIMAMIEISNITEARISRLVSPFTPELPAFLANKPGLESGYMIAHYTVAAIVNKLRGLSHPNITDNIPVSGNQEDHVSMVMNTATRAWEVYHLCEEVVIFELMMAIRGLKLVDHPKSSPLLDKIMSDIDQNIIFEEKDHIIHKNLIDFKNYIEKGEIYSIIDEYLDFPENFNI